MQQANLAEKLEFHNQADKHAVLEIQTGRRKPLFSSGNIPF
jgi:hypothetical protein